MYPEGFQEVIRMISDIYFEREIIILFMMKRTEKEEKMFRQIIQFEIVLRDTPLISHNECLSFVDIKLKVLFA